MQAATLSSTAMTSFPPSSATALPKSAFFFDVLPITTNCIPFSGFPPPLAATDVPTAAAAAEPTEADGTDGTLTFGKIRSRFTYLYFLLHSTKSKKLINDYTALVHSMRGTKERIAKKQS